MYTCYTCCMNKEMMEMEGWDSAKCQKSKLGDINGILEIVLNDNKTNYRIVLSPSFKSKTKREKRQNACRR